MLASSRGHCGRTNTRGRDKSRPYEQILCFGPTGMAATTRTTVGRDALIPPDLTLPQGPRADMESAPTNRGKARDQPGKREPGNVANLCRGRCLHRPGDIAAAQTPAGGINPAPTNRGKARGYPGKREPGNVTNLCRGRFYIGPVCDTANTRGRDKSRPYEQILCFGPTGTASTTRADVGRGALTPPDRAAAQTPWFTAPPPAGPAP